MARFLRTASRILVTAGAMSTVPLALASTPYVPPADTPPSANSGVHLVGVLHVSQSQAQLEAMKVEMAWLADRTTYQFHLEVEIKGEGLEVRGQVPDEPGHQRALEVARQGCYLPVSDAIRIVPNSPVHSPTPETIAKASREALNRQFGARSSGFDVKVTPHGQIILRGQVGSVEEKLTASRCLRGQQGVTAIVNCLGVTPIRHAGHTITLVTTDGRHAVHGIVSITAEVPDDDKAVTTAEATSPALPHSSSPAPLPPALSSALSSAPTPSTFSSAATPSTPSSSPTLTLPSGLPQPAATASALPALPPPSASTPAPLPPRVTTTTPMNPPTVSPMLSLPAPSAAMASNLPSPPDATPSPASLPPAPEPILPRRTISQPIVTTQSSTTTTPFVPPASGYGALTPSILQPTPVQSLPSYPPCTSCTKGMQLAVAAPTQKEPVRSPSLWERLTSFAHRKPKETTVIVASPPPATPAKTVQSPNSMPVGIQATAAATTTTPAPRVGTTATNWPPAYRGQQTAAAPSDATDQFRQPTLQVRRPNPPPLAELSPLPPAVQTSSAAPSPVIRVSSTTTTGQSATPVVAAVASATPGKAAPSVVGTTSLPGPMGPPLSPIALRKAVQKGCGKLAREVRVEKGKEGQLKLHVIGYRESEQQLIASLLALPEVASTSVRLEIHVSH
jgi:hypothetical protein